MKISLEHIILHTAYPLLLVSGVIAHIIAVSLGWNLYLATYAPMLVVGSIIAILELIYPYRKQWHMNKNDFYNDFMFMTCIQIILPTILSFFISIVLLNFLKDIGLTFNHLWIHSLPVTLQALLMLVLADFFGYWVHRLSHKYKYLWKFHSVHHSPHKLYWVNVGRFHPIEKTYQYCFSTLPFLLLGVNPEVIALYFVLYGINGFFQHCNIDLRLGKLNYIFSGPELHHWHHSKQARESNNNFGNTLIIYDILFDTYYFPQNKIVGELGLKNRHYPTDFLTQMKAPFMKTLNKKGDSS